MSSNEYQIFRKAMERGKKYWFLIDNLDDPQKSILFERSKSVYDRLFEPKYRENFDSFKKYIKQDEVQDRYYVAIYNDDVVGLLFFTIYEKWIFISYGGVDYYKLKERSNIHSFISSGMFGVIQDCLELEKSDGALFELEKLRDTDILKLAFEPSFLEQNKEYHRIINRIRATYTFQKLGAWKIPFIDYRQPPPGSELGAMEVSMHLMYIPAQISDSPPKFDSDYLNKLIEFVYLEFYLDGFDESKDYIKGSRENTVNYLDKLYKSTIKAFPNQAFLINIDLTDINFFKDNYEVDKKEGVDKQKIKILHDTIKIDDFSFGPVKIDLNPILKFITNNLKRNKK